MKLTLSNLCSIMSKNTKTFLFWFSNELSNFRISELDALFKLCKLDLDILSNRQVQGPFIFLDFPNEDGPRQLMNRSVLVHSCYEIWGSGKSLNDLHEDFKNNLHFALPYENKTFQIRVETYGKSIKHTEKLKLIETFTYLPFKGKVNLKTPECSLHLLQYYGLDSNNVPPEPYHNYFCRWIVDGQRKLASMTNLKERKFIGNTSMDPLLSLLMANLAGVTENDIVYDPFVGTGSLLVAAAVMGANVVGSDIDYLMLHAKTRSSRAFTVNREKDESIRTNLIQYGVGSKYLDVLVSDASRPMWRDDFQFDAIITDPPYGIREPSAKLGTTKVREPGFKIKKEHLETHYPSKIDYSLTTMFRDLMNFGAKNLIIGGRLVFWIPISRFDYDEEKLPKNPCLSLVSNNEQILTSYASRRLLVFAKLREHTTQSLTEIDETALMYKFKLFECVDQTITKTKRERKTEILALFGGLTKRGQIFTDETGSDLYNMTK